VHKVITLSDKNYFEFGHLFLKTRPKVNAKFILYGPDLTKAQQKTLKNCDVEYKEISKDHFENKMQFMKFELIKNEIDLSDPSCGISLLDFDTFFLREWDSVFSHEFDLGITVRNSYVTQKILRAYANGGVIFGKHSKGTMDICDYALKVMEHGKDALLPEYDEIFKTLEHGRPANKTHKRETLRWWVDQVFLSSLVYRYFKTNGYTKINEKSYLFGENNIGLFGCERYNCLDVLPGNIKSLISKKKTCIIHLKDKGRSNIKAFERMLP
jgi:hypothetical protein